MTASLRFVDSAVESAYQRQAGAESHGGLRIITGTSAVMWFVAAFLVPIGTSVPAAAATPAALVMAAVSACAFVAAARAVTLDLQHLIASLLTASNGLVILWLASIGGALPGYGVSAVILLFAYGFVSRTGFVYGVWRSAVIAAGFLVAAVTYHGEGNLLIDGFLFGAAIFGTLLGLRMLEISRRRVFAQERLIGAQSTELEREKEKSDGLVRDILPARIADRLRAGERTIADEYPSVSVLFADIVGFTPLAERLSPPQVIEMLSRLFSTFDDLVAERGLEKIKTMGDSYMAAGGLPERLDDHAVRTVDLGLEMIKAAARLKTESGMGCALRVGIHSGPVIGGVIGRRKFAFDLWGDTVNIASRLESHGVPNQVQISAATWRLVKHRFDATPRGQVNLRGHEALSTYSVEPDESRADIGRGVVIAVRSSAGRPATPQP